MLIYKVLVEEFPPTTAAMRIGPIPMSVFELNEKAIREVTRAHGLRAIYRGPRVNNNTFSKNPSMTCRADATHVTFYLAN